jgi:predicted negative regulator of RcsB-dependent stress response
LSLPSQHSTRLEQPGAEIMVPLTRFWERNGRIGLGVLAGLLVIGVMGYFFMRSKQADEEAAAGKLAEASLLYWQGDYQRSLQLARDTATRYASTPSGLDAHRQAADAAYWGGDFKTAIAEYRRYLAKNNKGLLADAAHRSLAYALESDRQFVDAAHEYEALIGRFDRGSSAEFLEAAARCYVGAGQPQQAQDRLRRLVDEFGETDAADMARVELAELQTIQSGGSTH